MKKHIAILLLATALASPALAQTKPELQTGFDAGAVERDSVGETRLAWRDSDLDDRRHVNWRTGHGAINCRRVWPQHCPGCRADLAEQWRYLVDQVRFLRTSERRNHWPIRVRTAGSFTGTAPIVPTFPGGGVVNYAISNGVSVANPGTGTLEDILPPQTVTGTSKTFATADLFKKTRRSNAGSAMSDTFPASTATGMTNL